MTREFRLICTSDRHPVYVEVGTGIVWVFFAVPEYAQPGSYRTGGANGIANAVGFVTGMRHAYRMGGRPDVLKWLTVDQYADLGGSFAPLPTLAASPLDDKLSASPSTGDDQ